jgi:hypothetical protein
MSTLQKLQHELAALVSVAAYFACWTGLLVVLKQRVLNEYRIAFHGLSMALPAERERHRRQTVPDGGAFRPPCIRASRFESQV